MKKKLLLHSCCGPCSTSVLERLVKYFDVDIYFYNPSIQPQEEYLKRLHAQIDVLDKMKLANKVSLIVPKYNTEEFEAIAKGNEDNEEGGLRCKECIKQRIFKTAEYARNNKYDAFTTTLSVSSYKNSEMIWDLQYDASIWYKIPFIPVDFGEAGGEKRSQELSKQFNLYEQNYCGCLYGKKMMKEPDRYIIRRKDDITYYAVDSLNKSYFSDYPMMSKSFSTKEECIQIIDGLDGSFTYDIVKV